MDTSRTAVQPLPMEELLEVHRKTLALVDAAKLTGACSCSLLASLV